MFIELSGQLNMSVLSLKKDTPASVVVSMLFSKNHISLADEDKALWSLYERRIQREGIFERPFGDDEV